MSIELLVNVAPFETRIARIENNLAEEIYIERESERGLKGNIYKGRVQRVLPGIQAAFVDIGMEKAGFLYAGDIAIAKQDSVELPDELENGDGSERDNDSSESHYSRRSAPAIASLIKDGQELMVQVSREPIASKGPRLTTQVGLAGR